MDDRLRDSEDRRAARRRLLKGSFATPAVMTLCSGSALAASSALHCAAGLPTGATPVTTEDNIFRIKEYKTKLTGDWFTVFSGADVINAATTMSTAPYGGLVSAAAGFDSGKWYRVSDGVETTVGGGNNAPAKNPTGNLLALRLTNNGSPDAPAFTIVGVAASPDPTGSGRIMTTSCWGSVF